ncbi:MAG: hypothetical protein JNM02_04640 [Anaerolineales bacterium]|nr:hypothetical protein [Anaerolineales bacterium]
MKSQYRMLFAFVALLTSVSLACSALAPAEPTATSIPTNPPPPTAAPLPTASAPLPNPSGPSNPAGGPSGNTTTSGTSSDIVTFVDENNLFGFDLPGDWYYEHNAYDNYYVDTFTSPDESSAKIESIVYNDGTAFNNSDSAATALAWLNQFYSYTGQEGDIRVSKHQVEKDGSESLEWSSKGGDYSGKTFYEVRGDNRKTFMLFTVWYINDIDQETLDIVNNAVQTYYIP